MCMWSIYIFAHIIVDRFLQKEKLNIFNFQRKPSLKANHKFPSAGALNSRQQIFAKEAIAWRNLSAVCPGRLHGPFIKDATLSQAKSIPRHTHTQTHTPSVHTTTTALQPYWFSIKNAQTPSQLAQFLVRPDRDNQRPKCCNGNC